MQRLLFVHLPSLFALLAVIQVATAQSVRPAQTSPALRLSTGPVLLPANLLTRDPVLTGKKEASSLWHGRTYQLLQFTQLPDEAAKQALQASGVALLQYLPENAYVASWPPDLPLATLQQLGARTALPMQPEWKIAQELQVAKATESVDVVVQLLPVIEPSEATTLLAAAGYPALSLDTLSRLVTVRTSADHLRHLAAWPWVAGLDPLPPPEKEEASQRVQAAPSLTGNSLHRANNLAAGPGSTNRRYDGTGVVVSVGEEYDMFAHVDFAGRVVDKYINGSVGTHPPHVLGILLGAGTGNPSALGHASGATGLLYKGNDHLQHVVQDYRALRVRITNSSLGGGLNSRYGAGAKAVDKRLVQYPFLMHVFSAGNSGRKISTYGTGPTWGAGWATLTGDAKQAKNALTVGNVGYDDRLGTQSSRGPTRDGRIKPDVCAMGIEVYSSVTNNRYATKSGTSMAAPAVAGTLAQLMQAYRALNNESEAPAALLKAALLNTAEDLGQPGPDFQHGYGRINALRAVRTLEQRTYTTAALGQSEQRVHPITVVPGQRELRVLLYWADPAPTGSNSTLTLVNDLDLTLTAPDGTIWQPWVLQTASTRAALGSAAVRGRDSLNNVEQITLAALQPGTYMASVRGQRIPLQQQTYYLTHSPGTEALELTYPVGGEALVPGEKQIIRWDAPIGSVGTLDIHYSLDDGSSWQLIRSGVALSAQQYTWPVPQAALSGRARIRLTQSTVTSQSAAAFTIAGVPTQLRLTRHCKTTAVLTWQAVTGATQYEVFRLSGQYLAPVTTVTGTSATVPVTPGIDEWYTVRALGPGGLQGRRALAVRRLAGQATTCP